MVDPTLKKTRELMRRLTRATEMGAIEWEAVDDTSFSYDRGEGSVYVASVDKDGQAPYVLEVFNRKGQAVETARSSDLPSQASKELSHLYETVRRRVHGVDELLDDLMKDLPDDPDPYDLSGSTPF